MTVRTTKRILALLLTLSLVFTQLVVAAADDTYDGKGSDYALMEDGIDLDDAADQEAVDEALTDEAAEDTQAVVYTAMTENGISVTAAVRGGISEQR